MTAFAQRDVLQSGAGRLAEIEVLRAVAILMVLAEHLPFNLFYWGGWFHNVIEPYWRGAAGVDLFFVVSGFVIARTLLPQLAAAQAAGEVRRHLAAFWARRALRLWPAAWWSLAAGLMLTIGFNRSGAFRAMADNLPSAAAAFFHLANFYLAKTAYFRAPSMFFYFWSLALEEQFYLLLPLLVLLLRRRLIWLMLMAIAYQFVMPVTMVAALTRPAPLAMGVFLAISARRPLYARLAPRFLGRVGWAGPALLLILVGLLGFEESAAGEQFEGRGMAWGLLAPLGGLLVFIASFNADYLLRPSAARRLALWVGARSYSLYLLHIPCFALAVELEYRLVGQPGIHRIRESLALMAIGLPLSFFAADILHRFVEVPMRLRGANLARWILEKS